jgi:hypothetical protein
MGITFHQEKSPPDCFVPDLGGYYRELRDFADKLKSLIGKDTLSASATGYSSLNKENTFNEITIKGVGKDDLQKLMAHGNEIQTLLKELGFPGSAYLSMDSDNSIIISNKPFADCVPLSKIKQAGSQAEWPSLPKLNAFTTGTPVDFVTHHNQALEAIAKAKADGLVKTHATLLHFDTHSDLTLGTSSTEGIADYLNQLTAKGDVSTLYWVVPDQLKPQKITDKEGPTEQPTRGLFLEQEPPYTKTLYLDSSGKFYDRLGAVPKDEKTMTVDVRICRQRDLPDFSGNSNVILDVDEDYFSNTGNDTIGNWGRNPSRDQLISDLNAFKENVGEKRINPALTIVSRSPRYTSPEVDPTIRNFFSNLSQTPDYIPNSAANYSHGNASYQDSNFIRGMQEWIEEYKQLPYVQKVYDDICNRGFSDLADRYKLFCDGKLSQKEFLTILTDTLSKLESRKH